jgi:hypothetical protein
MVSRLTLRQRWPLQFRGWRGFSPYCALDFGNFHDTNSLGGIFNRVQQGTDHLP